MHWRLEMVFDTQSCSKIDVFYNSRLLIYQLLESHVVERILELSRCSSLNDRMCLSE